MARYATYAIIWLGLLSIVRADDYYDFHGKRDGEIFFSCYDDTTNRYVPTDSKISSGVGGNFLGSISSSLSSSLWIFIFQQLQRICTNHQSSAYHANGVNQGELTPDAQHMQIYGVDYDTLWGCHGIFKQEFGEVASWIQSQKWLSKDQALAIWDRYAKKRWVNAQAKEYYRVEIEKTFDWIEKHKQAQEKRKADLETRENQKRIDAHNISQLRIDYHPKNLYNAQGLSKHQQARNHAFEQTKTQHYTLRERSYQLHAEAEGFLHYYALQTTDYTTLRGTALQHQLHTEFCSVVDGLSLVQHLYPNTKDLVQSAVLLVDAGIGANKENLLDLTVCLADTSQGIMGFILGASQETNRLLGLTLGQAFDSLCQLPETTAHGILALYDFLHTQATFHETLYELERQQSVYGQLEICQRHIACKSEEFFDRLLFSGKEAASSELYADNARRLCERQEHIINVLSQVGTEASDWVCQQSLKSACQMGETALLWTTDQAVNLVVPEAVFAKVTTALVFFAGRLQVARNLDLIKRSLLPAVEAGVLQASDIEYLAQAQIAKQLEQAACQLQEAESVVQSAQKAVTSGSEIVVEVSETTAVAAEVVDAAKAAEIAKNHPKVSYQSPRNNRIADQLLIDQITKKAEQYFVISEELLLKVRAFAQKNKYMEVLIDGKVETVIVDWEHILLPSVKPRMPFNHATKLTELDNIKITGWHHGLWQDFEKQGLIKIVNKAERNGCVYLEFEWPYGKIPEKKAFFAESWDYEKIKDAIKEATVNITEIVEKKGDFSGLGKNIVGRTKEGIIIEIKLTRENATASWKAATACIQNDYILGIKV